MEMHECIADLNIATTNGDDSNSHSANAAATAATTSTLSTSSFHQYLKATTEEMAREWLQHDNIIHTDNDHQNIENDICSNNGVSHVDGGTINGDSNGSGSIAVEIDITKKGVSDRDDLINDSDGDSGSSGGIDDHGCNDSNYK